MDISMIHTNAGLKLLAKLERGIPLRITRVCSGAGRSADLENLTALIDEKQTLEMTGQSQKGTQATIYVRLTNIGLNVGYDLTQIGVYAEDPDDGEILYRVAQFERAIPISAETDFPDFSVALQIIDTISNASHIEVTIDPTGMVTAAQFQNAVALLQAAIDNSSGSVIELPGPPITGAKLNFKLMSTGRKWGPWPNPEDEWPELMEPVEGYILTPDGQAVKGGLMLEDGTTAELVIRPENSGA